MKKLLAITAAMMMCTSSAAAVSAAEERAQGDVNNDGRISVTDLSIVAAHVKTEKMIPEEDRPYADRNGDNRIDVRDIARLAAYLKNLDRFAAAKADIDNFARENGIDSISRFVGYRSGGGSLTEIVWVYVTTENNGSTEEEKQEYGKACIEKLSAFVREKDLQHVRVEASYQNDNGDAVVLN